MVGFFCGCEVFVFEVVFVERFLGMGVVILGNGLGVSVVRWVVFEVVEDIL